MCGICGIIDLQNRIGEKRKIVVEQMNQALLHRGPDEGGAYHDLHCSLAMRRLSIIDLSQGQQPQYNTSKSVVVFQNGEIYNYQSLRKTLIQRGFVFQTQSDTEVLAHLYEAEGTAMFGLLKGMFAICIYDRLQKTFILARDRFGEKPLYYHWDQNVLSFSSEVQSLLENQAIERRLDPSALLYYFRTSLVPEPLTLLKGIHSLPPGHYLQVETQQLQIKKYFDFTYTVDNRIQSDEAAMEFIRPHLLQAVRRQTVSDVPIGAFLSGGIDSSTVVALLQKNADHPIKTFNVRFEDQAYDESPIARKVAAFCGTDHQELVIPNYDFDESIFWNIIHHVGLPFRDSSAIPSYLISKAIGKEVKVALSGDGGDELFGGYALFQWYQKIRATQQIARPLRAAGHQSLHWAQKIPGLQGVSTLRQVQRALRTSLETPDEIPISLNELFNKKELRQLFLTESDLQRAADAFPYVLLKEYPSDSKHWTPLRKIMYYRTRHTLPANMLIKIDRMSMANSLEVRAPFLDPDLFDAAAQLPDRFLIRKGNGKWIIRKIMEQELPAAVFDHPKMGFSIPLFKYQNQAFQQLAHKLLFEENPFPGLWDQTSLQKIYHQGLHTKKNTAQISVFQAAHRLWMMMQLLGWAQRFNVQLP
ncbi:MAG: asparagine synthase (glutamine-hydrolyzing) [Bacteroidota bacterium]